MKTHCKLSSGRSARAAFTIVELLVAVGVTALMVSLMLTIVVNVLGGWNRSSGTLSSGNQARTVMDLITGDLQSAILRRDGNVWLVATVQTAASGWTTGSANNKPSSSAQATNATATNSSLYIPAFPPTITDPPTTLEDYRFGQGGVWLRLFTTVPDTNVTTATISAPRAVSYKIVRQNVTASGSESRYMLYRSELPPDTTFTTGYNLFDAAYTGVASVLRTPNSNSLIANNVIDFGIRLFKSNSSNQLIPIFPDTNEVCFAATSDSTKVGAGVEATPKRDFPTVAEVFVRILTDEGATQIANWEAGLISPPSGTTSAEFWWQIALANSRVYTRRVEIKATSL